MVIYFLIAFSLGALVAGTSWFLNAVALYGIPDTVSGVLMYQGSLLVLFAGSVGAATLMQDFFRRAARGWLVRRYPRAPWLWRADWVRRRSMAVHRPSVLPTVFAAAWLLASTPLLVAVFASHEISVLTVSIGAFAAAIDVLLLALVARYWKRYWSFTRRPLRFIATPARVGNKIAFEMPAHQFGESVRWHAELVCRYYRVTTVRGGSRYQSQQEMEELFRQTVSPQLYRHPKGNMLHIRYSVPMNQPASGVHKQGYAEWRVVVRGMNRDGTEAYGAEYIVPLAAVMAMADPQADSAWRDAVAAQPQDAIEFEELDDILAYDMRGQSSIPSQVTAKLAPLPTADAAKMAVLADSLAKSGIYTSSLGIEFADEHWERSANRLHAGYLLWAGFLAGAVAFGAMLLAVATNTIATLVGAFVVAAVAPILFALAGFSWLRRTHISLNESGLAVWHQFLFFRWSRPLRWDELQSITCQWVGTARRNGYTDYFRRLVANPDTPQKMLPLTPGLTHLEALDQLGDWLMQYKLLRTQRPVEVAQAPVPSQPRRTNSIAALMLKPKESNRVPSATRFLGQRQRTSDTRLDPWRASRQSDMV